MCYRFMDKAAELWSIGERPENWALYYHEPMPFDAPAEFARWDNALRKDCYRFETSRYRRKHDAQDEEFVDFLHNLEGGKS